MPIPDHYEHIRLIGEGYFSLVKLYKDNETGQEVAIKDLKESFEDNADYVHRFEREVQLLKLLSGHKNIIELLGYECEIGSHFYIMPAADTNLFDYIQTYNNSLEMGERIKMFDQVLDAIKFAHSKGILHRDISPRNILLFEEAEEYKVKVSDFGLGKNLRSDSAFTRSVIASYGQLYYVAPEQFDRLKDATIRSDIYSLGRLLDFILTGRTPATTQNTNFRTLIEKATQVEPELRHNDIAEFERVYEGLKNLLGLGEDLDSLETLYEFVRPDGTIDWELFQKFAVRGHYYSDVYDEYIGIVVEFLSDRGNLRSYIEVTGDSIAEFVNVFIQRIAELPSTGWPFSATTDFAELLKNIFFLTRNLNIKLRCLKGIWEIAYERRQFGAQDIMLRILDGNYIPEEIQTDFAAAIMESSETISPDVYSSLKIPTIIRRALIQKARRQAS